MLSSADLVGERKAKIDRKVSERVEKVFEDSHWIRSYNYIILYKSFKLKNSICNSLLPLGSNISVEVLFYTVIRH